jgi:leucyl-tRNA synthetase
LPAENYAIKSGVSPQESMATIIPMYHKQYKAMGWSNDWEKEIATHLPEYYKWTQWIFLQMHKHGLAYQDSRLQWWCPIDNSVLADEQVINGKCWRHDGPNDPPAEKREVKQWFFKITEYADELLEATKDLDWSESVKLAQENWIGKSVGAEVTFKIKNVEKELSVFTTAHDTIYGATFMVVAPEFEAVDDLTTPENKKAVRTYVEAAEKKTEVERQSEKTKTGVFTGSYAINPVNGKEIPIWVADYVLSGYGTGAIMAVPGEDERDHEFAQKFGLEIIYTTKQQEFVNYSDIKAAPQKYTVANSDEFDGQTFQEARPKILNKLIELKAGSAKVNYRMRDWSVSRQRYWGAPIPVINCPKCGPVMVPEEDLPVVLPELENFSPTGDGRSALARAKDWLEVECPKCGGQAERETDTLDTYVDSSWYMYRYFDPHNQEKIFDENIIKKWEPIDFYNGADHATAHLLYTRFIARFFHKIGLVNQPEPFKQFLFNGKVTAHDGAMFSKSKGNGVDPLDIIESGYGADALRTYLMFAAPLEIWARWDPQGVAGAFRFLTRLWNIVQEYSEASEVQLDEAQQKNLLKAVNKMIKKATIDIEENRYNTAIASLMECLNQLYKLKDKNFGKSDTWHQALENIVACAAPFAPHITEELWQQLGHSLSIHHDTWPKWDEELVKEEMITLAVQVNGKVRGEILVSADISEQEAIEAAKANEKVADHIKGKELKKAIYVAGRLVSLVI